MDARQCSDQMMKNVTDMLSFDRVLSIRMVADEGNTVDRITTEDL